MSFIGQAINIWVDTLGTGGVSPPTGSNFLLLTDGISYLLLDDGASKLILNN